eukprot:236134-Chlamydomonas_euryale.AAC.1
MQKGTSAAGVDMQKGTSAAGVDMQKETSEAGVDMQKGTSEAGVDMQKGTSAARLCGCGRVPTLLVLESHQPLSCRKNAKTLWPITSAHAWRPLRVVQVHHMQGAAAVVAAALDQLIELNSNQDPGAQAEKTALPWLWRSCLVSGPSNRV